MGGERCEMLEMESRDSFARRALPFSDDREQHLQEDKNSLFYLDLVVVIFTSS